ncbi:MAG TPA: nitrile hydratase subunit beta [Stellaceae bacterium]|jgi:nitrile hydratase|nr:nitrile hydratase subunit beta [Stellaceae bacterium]
MNGVHDMGGMHGMGPIAPEADDPVFHEPWEARVFALYRATSVLGKWNIDAGRHARERIPPADYLRMSYYEKWFAGLITVLEESGLATRAEVENGRPAPGTPQAIPPLRAEQVAELVAERGWFERPVNAPPRFAVGQAVRAKKINPTGHTRLPRYARGNAGIIDRIHGAHVFPDSNAHFRGECPQHLYSVRFSARELWGESASARDAVYIDLWEDYLEPA